MATMVASGAAHGIYRVHTDGRIEHVSGIKPKFRLEDF